MKKPASILSATALGVAILTLSSAQAAPPRLLPFQGRLTDASGTPVPDGAKVVQFKIYNAPTGGTAVWNGEVQKVTVNGGLVSTLLGSKATLDAVDFNQALYLEISVDANADNQITAADPPLLPRQSILPAVFAVEAQSARDSTKLQGFDWSAIIDNGNPVTGKISASRLADGSITNAQLSIATISADRLVGDTVTAAQIAQDAIGNDELAANSVTSGKIADATVQPADIAIGFGLVPTGTVVAFAGSAPPAGWLPCDGAAVSRTSYATLYSVIGNTHGVGDGAATFNLPDYRGRFLRGVDGGAGRDPDVASRTAMASGGNTGDLVGSLQADELKSHAHALSNTITRPSGGAVGGTSPTGAAAPAGTNFISATATGGSETRPRTRT